MIYKNAAGNQLDTSKYTNLSGNDLNNWVTENSKTGGLFSGYSALETANNASAPPTAPIKINDLTSAPSISSITQTAANNDNLLNNIQSTYDKYTGNASANDNFINGVVKYATGKDATAEELAKYKGQSLSNIVTAYNIGGKLKNFAMVDTNNPADKTNNSANQATQDNPKSSLDQKFDLVNNYKENKTEEKTKAQTEQGIATIKTQLNDAQTKANDLLTNIETTKSKLEAEDILNDEAKIALKDKLEGQGRGIPLSVINQQLLSGTQDLDQQQRLKRLYDTYELNTNINQYNAQLRNVQLIQGNYQQAQDNVKDTINDWAEEQKLKLDILTEQGQLEKEERVKYEKEIEYERELGMEGYTYVENTETYNKLVKELGVTASTFNQFFYKDPANGRIYLKPGNTGADATVTAYVDQIRAGKIKLTNVPADVRDKVAVELNKSDSSSNSSNKSNQSVTYKEGDVVKKGNKYQTMGIDGKWKDSTKEEIANFKGELTDDEKKFETVLNGELKKLAKGGDWGSSWNYLHNLYPEATNEQLDAMLNKDKYYPQ